jgi:hypothetical protein
MNLLPNSVLGYLIDAQQKDAHIYRAEIVTFCEDLSAFINLWSVL